MDLSKLSTEELQLLKQLKIDIDHNQDLSSQEQAYKTILNSLYGALATPSFMWYNIDIAECITLTGQNYTRSVIHYVNEDFEDKFKLGIKDYIPAGDTDSVMICLGEIVKKYYKGEKDNHKITDWILEFDRLYLSKLIDSINNGVSDYLNAYDPSAMDMKREVIADKALFLAKKRYVMNVIDKEGVRYYKPKWKLQGIEIVRSNTPQAVKDMLMESIPIIFYKTEKDVAEFCGKCEKEFKQLDVATIAIPSGVNGIDKYQNGDTYRSGTPKHVRASILYNNYLDRIGLSGEIEPIKSGDKIKWIPLVTPNPVTGMENVIAFQGDSLPDFFVEEVDIRKFIDYDELFDRAFKKPLTSLTDVLGYNVNQAITLDDLFD